jgi:hypothetical protein
MANSTLVSGFEATLRLSRDGPTYPPLYNRFGTGDWLKVLRGCVLETTEKESFSGSDVLGRVGWFPGLNKLVSYDLLEKNEVESSRKHKMYTFVDRDGVIDALVELNYIDPSARDDL